MLERFYDPYGNRTHVTGRRSLIFKSEYTYPLSFLEHLYQQQTYHNRNNGGHHCFYSCDTLQKAQQAGIIDSKVMALGGITLEHLPEIAALGFGGAVLLGDG